MALRCAELIRAVLGALEGAAPAIDGPSLMLKTPLTRIELKGEETIAQ